MAAYLLASSAFISDCFDRESSTETRPVLYTDEIFAEYNNIKKSHLLLVGVLGFWGFGVNFGNFGEN